MDLQALKTENSRRRLIRVGSVGRVGSVPVQSAGSGAAVPARGMRGPRAW